MSDAPRSGCSSGRSPGLPHGPADATGTPPSGAARAGDAASPVPEAAPRLLVLVLLVAAGGAVGGLLRYGLAAGLPPVAVPPGVLPLTGLAPDAAHVPVATLTANLLGCLALGALVGAVGSSPRLRALLGTGLLGGFTTFSTLALEVDRLVAVAPVVALVHLAGNTGGGLALAALALRAGTWWRARRDRTPTRTAGERR